MPLACLPSPQAPRYRAPSAQPAALCPFLTAVCPTHLVPPNQVGGHAARGSVGGLLSRLSRLWLGCLRLGGGSGGVGLVVAQAHRTPAVAARPTRYGLVRSKGHVGQQQQQARRVSGGSAACAHAAKSGAGQPQAHLRHGDPPLQCKSCGTTLRLEFHCAVSQQGCRALD